MAELKRNWNQFKQILDRYGIQKLYHFTDRDNLKSIINNGGLYSWADCKDKSITIPRPGGDGASRSLDIRDNLQYYVRVSFVRNHPMQYVAMNDGRISNPVLLEIDPKVIFWEGTKYADRNATKNGANIGDSLSDLRRIHFNSIKANTHFDLDEDEKEFFQAEVLVKNFIPLECITNIRNFGIPIPNNLSKNNYNDIKTQNTSNCLTFNVDGIEFKMIKVEAGSFMMGCENGYGNQRPVHKVNLTKDYYIGETQVTQALWQAVMGSNSSYNKGDNKPIKRVSWNDCQEFIQKLNEKTGKQFRLPSEAEWEFAARGGNKSQGYIYAGSDDLDKVGWYRGNCSETQNVRQKQPNELGIYDMSGNVWEWCEDWCGGYPSGEVNDPHGPSNGSRRVLRGGCYLTDAGYCCVYFRPYVNTYYCYDFGGLRLAY